jgi:hypothetical protein
MKFHKVAHYFHVNKLSLHLDKTKIMLFYSNRAVQNLNADLFINNNSQNVDVENPDLLHKMKQIDSFSKIPATRFFLTPIKYHCVGTRLGQWIRIRNTVMICYFWAPGHTALAMPDCPPETRMLFSVFSC